MFSRAYAMGEGGELRQSGVEMAASIGRDGRPPADGGEAARKRAAVELLARHEATIRRTARRYSLCADDAEDALQRALEILLEKAPTDHLRELLPWMQTVTKHEALAIRRKRERLLGTQPRVASADEEEVDWLAFVPAPGDGPPERTVRREAIARSREALQALKPAELRALTLLAEGYSYAEISEITGYSRTKVNRCLAEGRERFRRLMSGIEDGSRCAELEPLLSAFSDAEATPEQVATLREHLRACAHCRSVLRSYRTAPRAAAALAPGLPLSGSFLHRAHQGLGRLLARLPGHRVHPNPGVGQLAAGGGAPGAGLTALVKTLAVCAGAAGTAAACVAVGIAPRPAGLVQHPARAPAIVGRSLEPPRRGRRHLAQRRGPAPKPATPKPAGHEVPEQVVEPPPPSPEAAPVEYEAPPVEAAPAPVASEAPEASGASAAGEFGP